MLARMVRPTLAALSALPFVLLACGEKAPPPVTPVTVESAEPATSGRPPMAKADAEGKGDEKPGKKDAPKKDEGGETAGEGRGEGVGLGSIGGATAGGEGRGEGIGLGSIGGSGGSGGFGNGHGRLGGNTGGAPPSLRQGATTVNGRLPPEVIQRIVRQNYGRFRLCYENGLRTNPKLAGQVTVKYTIDRSGNTVDVKDGGSSMPDAAVLSCVLRGFGNLTYPQPEGGIVTVAYPIIFTPGDAAPAGSAAPAKSAAPPPPKP